VSRTGFAPSGSARIAYEVEGVGNGPPVLLVHAGVTDRRAWWPVVEALKPNHTTLTFDQRGFGDTTFTPEPHSGVDDAVAVLEHAGIDEPVAVVACSMGGRLALDLTLGHPDRVERLVLIGSACRGAPGPTEWPESYRELGLALDAAEAAGDLDEVNRLEAWMWLDGATAPEGRVTGPARTMFLEMNHWGLSAGDPGDEIELPSAWDRLDQIAAPTLVLVGDLDLEDVRTTSEGLAERIPDATLEVLEGAAHLPHLERHPRLLELVTDFLS
jgi:pimeloyl-ACP methyl ester carboxylesterase